MNSIGERLGEALRVRDKTRADLARALREQGVRGASLPSIKTYIEGDVEPRLEFLLAASSFLGVRVEWLRSGEGPATVAEAGPEDVLQAALGEVGQSADPAEVPDMHAGAFAACMAGAEEELPWLRGPRADLATRIMVAQAAYAQSHVLLGSTRKFRGRLADGRSPGGERDREVGRITARAIMAPLEVLEIAPEGISPGALRRFVTGVAQAVAALEADLAPMEDGGYERTREALLDLLYPESRQALESLLDVYQLPPDAVECVAGEPGEAPAEVAHASAEG